MKLSAWQTDRARLKAARELIDKNATFQQIMQMAREESPANLPTSIGATESEHSRRLGYIEGYHHCLRVFEAAWTLPIRPKQLEATFEPPKE